MEINVNFILFEELKEKPDGGGADTRTVILRESKDVDSALDSAAPDIDSPE
jgi:hypothetical protein